MPSGRSGMDLWSGMDLRIDRGVESGLIKRKLAGAILSEGLLWSLPNLFCKIYTRI